MYSKAEIVDIVRNFLKINTSNPPGNEEEAALFIEDILRKAGLDCKMYLPQPRRANIISRIRGKKRGKPIILLSHIDVVPANPDEWDVDPFGAEVIEGYIYGRGAIDMKTQAICQLLSFIRYAVEGPQPERDIIYLATCDEEVGGIFGVEYMLRKIPALKNAAFVFSEGGFIKEADGFVHAQISVSEKRLSQFVIRASGTGGHGSIPHKDIANEKAIRAAANILSYSWPLKPTPVASAYMKGVLNRERCWTGFKDLREALHDKKFRDHIEDVPLYSALLRNTVTPTILRGGEKINVIPTESSVSFDARLLPSENHEKFFRKIKSLAGKDVAVERVSEYTGKPAPSGYNSVYYKGIREVIRHMAGSSVAVLPYITTGATDLRYFRDNGITAYGFFPFVLSGDDILRMHGRNERISVDNVHRGLEGAYRIIEFLGSKDVS